MLMASVRVAMITFDFYPFDPRVRRLAEAAADAGAVVFWLHMKRGYGFI